jgi:TonB-linked SusC/RagA family outer membrane protein
MNKLINKVLAIACILLAMPAALSGQTPANIAGTVFEDDGTTPMTGVSVVVKGKNSSAITDLDGNYSIKANNNDILVFSFLGYEDKTIIVGNRARIDITMKTSSISLSGTVVTALGIKREEKALGYAVSKVDNSEITNAASHNWLNGISGKVAGLNMNQAGAGPGGSVRVTLRGESSINPANSEALFVIDGIPMISDMVSSGGSTSAYNATSTDMPIDYGNGASDLNADDIENITVLKGAAATALYGSRAANGAIIITTKSGEKKKGVKITLGSTVTFEDAGYWPDFQDQYGSGGIGNDEYYSFYTIPSLGITKTQNHRSWGPRFEGQMYYQYGGKNEDGTYTATPWVARDWYKGFFKTGVTYNNYVAIEGGNGKGNTSRISFSNDKNDWITPNTGYNKQVVTVSSQNELSDWLTINAKVTYNRKQSDNLPQSGYGVSTIPYVLMWSQQSVDINWYKDYRIDDYTQNNPFTTSADNPYLQAYEQLNSMLRNRIYGNISLNAKINPHLNLMLRSGIDMQYEFRTQQEPFGSRQATFGKYKEQRLYENESNYDFLLKYDNKFGDFGFSGSVGGNIMTYHQNNSTMWSLQLKMPGIYKFANSAATPLSSSYRRDKSIQSLYSMIQLNYKDYVYVDITGRNDWSSTLAKGNNSYFYPSISTGILLSEIMHFNKSVPQIDLLKLRLSWANVGNDTDPYKINNYYETSTFGGGLLYPTSITTADLKPEMVESWEAGIESQFFKKRLGFDFTYYYSLSRNQILNAPVDPVTGPRKELINAGELSNDGVEIALNGTAIKTKDFHWDISLVYSSNRNKVIALADGIDEWVISSIATAQVIAVPGGSLGAIYGTGFERAPEGATATLDDGTVKDISGAILYDSNGYPIQNKTKLKYLGETQPKWKGGITMNFAYKNMRLNISADGQFGGHAWSLTNSMLSYLGKLNNSIEGRYDGLIGDGYVYDPATSTYSPNTTVTEDIGTYYDRVYNRDNVESNVFSTSFIKLREVSFEVSTPKRWLTKLAFISNASLSFFGRNLAMWTRWPQYDPEIAVLNGSTITTGFESGQFPMTRSYGFNIRLVF